MKSPRHPLAMQNQPQDNADLLELSSEPVRWLGLARAPREAEIQVGACGMRGPGDPGSQSTVELGGPSEPLDRTRGSRARKEADGSSSLGKEVLPLENWRVKYPSLSPKAGLANTRLQSMGWCPAALPCHHAHPSRCRSIRELKRTSLSRSLWECCASANRLERIYIQKLGLCPSQRAQCWALWG